MGSRRLSNNHHEIPDNNEQTPKFLVNKFCDGEMDYTEPTNSTLLQTMSMADMPMISYMSQQRFSELNDDFSRYLNETQYER